MHQPTKIFFTLLLPSIVLLLSFLYHQTALLGVRITLRSSGLPTFCESGLGKRALVELLKILSALMEYNGWNKA